ncbi:MAG: hypothetical protein ABIW84_02690 [Ilumatobacteraceae bacterium]
MLSLVYVLTIIAGAIGEWDYYILGSAIEVAPLTAIVCYAWTWPKVDSPTPSGGRPAVGALVATSSVVHASGHRQA